MARKGASKARHGRQLERKIGYRPGHDRILIVSEGSKTEPNYFNEIRRALRLHSASVVVRPSELGTAPIQVVHYAEQLFLVGDRHRKIQARAFDQVFAVFDRDDHESYFNALKFAESLDRKHTNDNKQLVRFQAIPSVPSFELWLLLHFEDIQSPIDRHEAMRRLKRHLPEYEKGCENTFTLTSGRLVDAYARADSLALYNSGYDYPEPYTAVATLVRLLTGLRV
jgi:hypothetical protein